MDNLLGEGVDILDEGVGFCPLKFALLNKLLQGAADCGKVVLDEPRGVVAAGRSFVVAMAIEVVNGRVEGVGDGRWDVGSGVFTGRASLKWVELVEGVGALHVGVVGHFAGSRPG